MSQKVVCECGHINPEGTILCEACGNPLREDQTKPILTMRYEGGALRSQTYKRTIVDKIWNYFSSVKVGIALIILILIAMAIGTILPQDNAIPSEDPSTYYPQRYGSFGTLYVQLGLDHLFRSWWWVILLGLLGLSLIVASIDRFIPLYRGLKNQRVTRHERYLKRQRLFGVTETEHPDEVIEKAKMALKDKHYKIREENGDLFAEKGRFARWGPYVNHLGLIIILIGGILRFVPGMYLNEGMWIPEGEQKVIPGTNGEYYLTNHKFILETYDKDNPQFKDAIDRVGQVAKNFQSNVTLYKAKGNHVLGEKPELVKVKDAQIKVNHPLEFNHIRLYQSDFRTELHKMNFKLVNKKTGKSYGDFSVNLQNPKETYDLGSGYKVILDSYLPDFYFDKKGTPSTKSDVPNNPAFVFKMISPEHPKGELSFVAIRTNIEPLGTNDYKIAFKSMDTIRVSGISVRKDMTTWIEFLGAILFLIGVGQGMYWSHRRIWVQRKNGELWVAGLANKHWHSIKKDLSYLVEKTGINEPIDQLEQKIFIQEKERGLHP
jgi:cytochrome c biogenesis protein